MFLRNSLYRGLLLAVSLTLTLSASAQTKRPLKHEDADSWRTISSPQLSRNGQFIAYALSPQEGDGEYVVRDLKTAKEWRQSTGSGGGLAAGGGRGRAAAGRAPTQGASARIGFTSDSKYVLLTVTPTKKEIAQAAADKKETPRQALVILDLGNYQVTRLDGVRSWTLPEDGGDTVAYFRLPKADPNAPPMRQPRPGPMPTVPTPVYGNELVLRNIGAKSERSINDVTEFVFSKDAKALVYAVSSKKDEDNGVYVTVPGTGSPPMVLLSGKGRYQRLTWDEKQEQLVFLADQSDTTSPNAPRKVKLHHWQRKSEAISFTMPPSLTLQGLVTLTALQAPTTGKAVELLSNTTSGFKANWLISERGSLSFSRDGSRVHLSTAPTPEPNATPVPADQRVDLDLWHWKDDFIQPMQKLRAESERNRTYQAIYHLKQKKFTQLGDETMQNITSASDGPALLGSDDRPYRRLVGQSTGSFSDVYMIDPLEGTRKLLRKKAEGGLSLSPTGKYVLSFDGKHWHCLTLATGNSVNLTGKLGVAFHNENSDVPGKPFAYGVEGWTPDDGFVLLQDRYDIWRVKPDGTEAVNLTQGVGRKNGLQFSLVNLNPRERAVKLDQPLLLHTINLETRDTGFHRLDPASGQPRCLIMAGRSFSPPVKARDADVYLLTAQTFNEYPDLIVTDANFKELKKITDANPQKKDFIWGKSELIAYKSADGVPLKGILIKPENFDPSKKYPMLVYIYERLSDNLHRFNSPRPGTSINPTFYASNGYLVLMPDIAYTVGSPGQSALKCVLPAIQAVVDKGIVDEKGIGIQGHSWGGYQIAYMVTQTTRFKAAVAGAPVVNMISAYNGVRWGTGLARQFQYEQSQSRIGGTLWQQPMKFIENSPIFLADRVQTPLMILHNDQDDAVPWYQGIEYYLALRRLEKEVYLLNYNGDRHGLTRRAHEKDYSVRMKEFFDHHLKGAAKPGWMERGVTYLDRVKKYGTPSSPFAPPPSSGGENEEEEP